MYQVSSSAAVLRAHKRLLSRAPSTPRVARTVLLLGLTSLVTDISSEMVSAVLPLYLVYVGGFTPLAYGVIAGVYQGAPAFVGLASGFIGDRFRRHKDVAASGYGLSAITKLLLATVGTAVSSIGAVILLDRIGKGILVLFVDPKRAAADSGEPVRQPTLRGALRLVRIPRYRTLLVAGGALSLATASDAFIFLTLQRKLDLGTSLFPLLFVASSAIYMLLAVPMGRLADRIGRGRVLLGGYTLLLGVYATLL